VKKIKNKLKCVIKGKSLSLLVERTCHFYLKVKVFIVFLVFFIIKFFNKQYERRRKRGDFIQQFKFVTGINRINWFYGSVSGVDLDNITANVTELLAVIIFFKLYPKLSYSD
jgi:hypothetical protein